jgi:peptidyl-prolyl cis-trans isomerase SurA
VEVSHILLRTGREKDNEKTKNTIFEIYDQLKAGVAWEELCSQFSEDINTKDDGGKLKPFGTGEMSAVPEFEHTAFSLEEPGQISDPFQTQYGWHIMRLERIVPKPTFESMKTSLRNSVTRDERTSLSKKDLQEKLRRDYKFTENTAVKNTLVALADSSLRTGKWNPSLASIAPKATVFTLADTPFSVESVVAYVKANQRPSKFEPAKQFDQLYNDFIDKKIIELVEAKIMADHPEYKYLLQEYYEGILLFDIMEKEVWTKASQDSVGQRTYYEANKDDYTSRERVHARIFWSADSTFRTALQQLIADSAEGAIDNFLTQNKVKEEEGIFEKKEKAVLGLVPWAKGLHPAENNGMYYLAWLKDILPAGPMSFEEARPGVISDYQTFLEKEWVKQLRKKYRVRMNDKGKRYILQQLVAKK